MALARVKSVFTYASSSGGVTYYFDITLDAQGIMSVGNIRLSTGVTTCTLPDCVLRDINEAQGLVSQLVAESDADHGLVTFTGQTQQDVVIAPGILNNTDYRVSYITSDFITATTINKTTTGFTVLLASPYGTVAVPKTIAYEVLVATHQTGTMGGSVTFAAADLGIIQVTFPTAFTTADYRVLLEPEGFFEARVINQLKTGFQIQLGFTLAAPNTATVGYDVFV